MHGDKTFMNLKEIKVGESQVVAARNPAVEDLIRALAQTVGNKVYLRDLEVLLNKIEMNHAEQETIYYLVRDLKFLK